MKLSAIIITSVSFIMASCTQVEYHKQIKENEGLTSNVYHNKEIGWSIELPKDWPIISQEKADELSEKANKIVEEMHEARNLQNSTDLIGFEKDEVNAFEAQLSKEGPQGEYQGKLKTLNDFNIRAFASRGIEIDTASGQEIVDGIVFNTFYTTIYFAPGEVIANQIIYTCLINGYIFCVTITYSSLENKKALVDTLKNSKFNSN